MKAIQFLFVLFLGVTLLYRPAYTQEGDPDNGEILFGQKCSICHGSSGEGGIGPTLVGCSRCDDSTEIFEKIDADMPVGNPGDCVDQCARDIAAFIFEVFNENGSETTTTTTTQPDGNTTTTIPTVQCPAEQIYGANSVEAQVLYSFRDTVLSRSPVGEKIIHEYYRLAPEITKQVEENEILRKWVKSMIDFMLPALQGAVE
jgi:hypothetical protein